jgi:hypothetical protein
VTAQGHLFVTFGNIPERRRQWCWLHKSGGGTFPAGRRPPADNGGMRTRPARGPQG